MLLEPITVQFSKSTLKPSVYTLRLIIDGIDTNICNLKYGDL